MVGRPCFCPSTLWEPSVFLQVGGIPTAEMNSLGALPIVISSSPPQNESIDCSPLKNRVLVYYHQMHTELEFLFMINFTLNVTPEVYKQYETELTMRARQPLPPLSSLLLRSFVCAAAAVLLLLLLCCV